MNTADWLLDALAAEGVTHLFGNPGSTELPVVEAAARTSRPRFVLGLHEAAVMGMADGFAQASGGMSAVNVHVQPGIANAMSGLLNAVRARVPMLVTVGQQVTGLRDTGPFLGGDVLGPVRPWVRWACEADTPDDLPGLVHDAVVAATTPPCGPVVLSLPMDVMAAPAPAPYRPAGTAPPAPRPGREAMDEIAVAVREASAPVILAGDGVVHEGAVDRLVTLAERLDAPVWGEPMAGRAPMPWAHPNWRGLLPPFAAAIAPILASHDLVLAFGMPVFRLFGDSPGPALPDAVRLIHVDVDPAEVNRNHVARPGVVAAVGGVLDHLLRGIPDGPARPSASLTAESGAPARGARVSPEALADALARGVGADDVLVDESLTAGRPVRSRVRNRTAENWFAHRGSALGWGLPAAVGVRMAHPDRRVMALHGDGSLLFGVHALWTAANEGAGVAVVVGDNGGYEILRAGMRGAFGSDVAWTGLDIDRPALDLVGICRGFGADAGRLDRADDLDDAIADLWTRAERGPAVLVVPMEQTAEAVGYPIPPASERTSAP